MSLTVCFKAAMLASSSVLGVAKESVFSKSVNAGRATVDIARAVFLASALGGSGPDAVLLEEESGGTSLLLLLDCGAGLLVEVKGNGVDEGAVSASLEVFDEASLKLGLEIVFVTTCAGGGCWGESWKRTCAAGAGTGDWALLPNANARGAGESTLPLSRDCDDDDDDEKSKAFRVDEGAAF